MKLDYDLFKQILSQIEAETDGFNYHDLQLESFQARMLESPSRDEELDLQEFYRYAYHFRLLAESGFINGRVDGETMGRQKPLLIYQGLTLEGHQLLEALQSAGIWNTIGKQAKSMGVAGLQQIPGLAVQAVWGAFVQ